MTKTFDKMKKDYILFGEDWEKEMSKESKEFLVDFLRQTLIKNQELAQQLSQAGDHINNLETNQ